MVEEEVIFMCNSEDLIKRSDTIKELKEYIIAEHEAISEHPDDIFKYNSGLLTAIQAVYDMPFADRPSGKWIVNISDYKSICSVCGANETHFIYGTEMWYGLGKSHFCPYCGARMKGE